MVARLHFENITVGEQTWRVHDSGGTGEAVVLFHGFPDTPESFFGVATALQADGYRTILPYLRGYHPDTIVPDRPYDIEHLAADGLGLLDALGLEQAIMIGHDWGATVCYAMTAVAPERIRGLITIAIPHPGALDSADLSSLKLSALWEFRHFVHFKAPFAEYRTRRKDFAYVSNPALKERGFILTRVRRQEPQDQSNRMGGLQHPS